MAISKMETGLDRLVEAHSSVVDIAKSIFEPLYPVLERDGKHEVEFDSSIVTDTEAGLFIHTPVILPEGTTKKDIESKPQIVGLLASSGVASDPVTNKHLQPGAYVVRLRPLLSRGLAFDFIDKRNDPVFSIWATPTEPGQFEEQPSDATVAELRILGVNASIGSEFCIDAISGADPLPGTGPRPQMPICTREVCLSFLQWKTCFIIRTQVALG